MRLATRITQWCVVLLLLCPGVVRAQVSGISYTLSPVGEYVFWEGDAGLRDGLVFGGTLGLGFGEFFEVGGVYLTGRGFETDFSDFSGGDETTLAALRALSPREIDLDRYGGLLRVNLSRGGLIPYLTLGTGVIRFRPDGLDENRYIYATGGAGLVLSTADRYTFTLGAEILGYRYHPGTLLSDAELQQVGLRRQDFNRQTVLNPAVRAALAIYLGGREPGRLTELDRAFQEQFQRGGLRLHLQPFYGQVEFHDDLNLPGKQPLIGLSAGVDLEPYIGLRGFYWRATDESGLFSDGLPDSFRDLSFYGGELLLRFSEGFGSIQPALLLGGGYMNVGDAYRGDTGFLSDSRFFATGGVSVDVPLVQALRLNVGVRGLFMSTQDVNDLSEPSSVYASLMYSGGIAFNLGRQGSRRPEGEPIPTYVPTSTAASPRERELEREIARLRAHLDSLGVAPPPSSQLWSGDPVTTAAPRSNLSGRTVTIPVPEQGEIYIRYGDVPAAQTPTNPLVVMPPGAAVPAGTALGALTSEEIRALIQQAVREEVQRMQPRTAEAEAALNERLRLIELRLQEQMQRELDRLRGLLVTQPPDVVPPGMGAPRVTRRLAALTPFTGYRFGSGPNQVLLGLRGDFRFSNQPRTRYLPELFVGVGEDSRGFGVIGSVAVPFAGNLVGEAQPYGGAGVGLTSESGLSGLGLALNLLVGAEYPLGFGNAFAEFSTLDFFDQNRLLVGYRIGFGGP